MLTQLDNFFLCTIPYFLVLAQAYYILDELLIAGELQETSKKAVLHACHAQDQKIEDEREKEKSQGIVSKVLEARSNK